MSTTEASINKLESDTGHTVFRPQRPPPPPPTQSEPSSNDTIIIPSEIEIISVSTETFDEPIKDVENDSPSLLFEFTELFDKFDYVTIRNRVLLLEMTNCPFTSVLWRIFLHCLPRDSSHWNQTINDSRDRYNELAETYLPDLHKISKNNGDGKDLNHPLSQEENSPWNQYFAYAELRENIDQDVRRTCQEIEFFRQQHILDLLLNVLYIHSRHHGQSLPYRQGMHEILAVIVYLIHMESLKINAYPESNELMKKLYDPDYLAHDSYEIYEKIMEHLRQFYDFKPNNVSKRKVDKSQTLFRRTSSTPYYTNDTAMRLNTIFERLKDYDEPLYEKLGRLSIEPMLYGIRWLRLLFGREVPFDSIPILWTVIFCYDELFGFVDYFFLALLNKIGELFNQHGISEYSFCLQYLMQPNAISDVESVIYKALSFERIHKQKLSNSFTQSMSDRLVVVEKQKPVSPSLNYLQNPLIDAMKKNSSIQFSKFDASRDKEMTSSPEKEIRRHFDDNVQMQKTCANYINQFIERIRRSIQSLNNPNEEEILIPLTGLEQIASVLEGKLIFDDNSFQSLLNDQSKEKSIDNDINNTV